jgi:excinuclease ABC subunit B
MGVFVVVVGINLLREGLDLPEVSLVAILDADKQGFLRSETALVQTVGRAARHIEGKVIMYGDTVTAAMQAAIDVTNERRERQMEYNKIHNITPRSIEKAIYNLSDDIRAARKEEELAVAEEQAGYLTTRDMPKDELFHLINDLEDQMKKAAQALEFEKAADLRDQILELRQALALKESGGKKLPAWKQEAA